MILAKPQSIYSFVTIINDINTMDEKTLFFKIGKKIQEIRESQNMTQDDLSAKSNLDNIGRIETGNTNPTIRTLYKISQALKVKLKDLVNVE
nr:helix-turn-helix transcriptional regulator [Odoribacter splanchnicus]